MLWGNLSVTLSSSSLRPFLASLSGTPTGIVWLFLGHNDFSFLVSGTLSSLLPLSESYRSGLAGTHTHTRTHWRSAISFLFGVSCCRFLLFLFSCVHLPLSAAIWFLSAILGVPLGIPSFWFSWDYLLLLSPSSDFTEVVLQLMFFLSFLLPPPSFLFLCGGCTTHLERGGPVFVRGIPPGLRTCPPPE